MGWLTAGNGLSLVISAVVGIALVRVLGPRDLGVFSLATVTATMLIAIVGFRLDQHLLTRLRNDDGDLTAFGSALRAAYAIYLPIAAIGVVASVSLFRGAALASALITLVEVGLSPLLFTRVALQTAMRQRDAFKCTAAARIAWLILVGCLLVIGAASVPAILGARVLSNLVEITFLHRVTGYRLSSLVAAATRSREAMTELRVSAPLAGSGLAGELHGRIDQPIVAAMKGSNELGLYAAAVRIADLAGMFAPIAQSVTVPALVDAARQPDPKVFDRVLRDGLMLALLPSAWVIAITCAQSARIVDLLAGREFADAAPLVSVLAAAEWVTFVGAGYASALLAIGRRRALATASFVGLAVNLGANLVFVPFYGAAAAAWTTLAGCMASAAVAICASHRIRTGLVETGPVVVVSALATIAAGAAAWALKSNILVSVAVGSATYAIPQLLVLRADLDRAVAAFRARKRRAVV